MSKLTADELAEINVETDEPSPHSLDPERDWLRISCSNGHELLVQDHQGGSVANCNSCGEPVDYRDAPEPEPETQTVTGAEVGDLHEVLGSDTARSAETT